MPGAGRVITGSAERWRAVRAGLNQRRHQLAQVAGSLYPEVPRVDGTVLLCRKEWLAGEPLELGEVALSWVEHPPPPAVTGAEPASESVRPLRADGTRYPRYAEALADLAPPALFEDRPSYRLLSACLAGGQARLRLGPGRYFDGVSLGEALAHELAAASDTGPVTMDTLPLRRLTGDPCDLSRRPATCAVTTLTLRQPPAGEPSFLLHWRDPAKVTHAGGLHQVMPVGIFQPAGASPASARGDLSLWRAMVREFSEELLGTGEDYRHLGSPPGYHRWPFYRELSAARAAGTLRVSCLGVGVDPLTLAADILTVAVFTSGTFDTVFAGLVGANAEGLVTRMPFTGETVERFTGGAVPMQPAGAAVLRLAWLHRASLLA
jgi:hypothetical protein